MSMTRLSQALLATAVLAACGGESGTISVSLTTAPGSTVLDGVQTLQLTVTEPREVFTAERSSDGFDISLDLPANGSNGALVINGYDAQGTRVATGRSPIFPVAAINARIVVYMAAPMSIASSPSSFAARSEMSAGLLGYGAIFVGGKDATGAASAQVEVYNAFDHSVLIGVPLPAPKVHPPVAVSGTQVFILGGSDGTNPTADFYLFDTTISPAGAYVAVSNPSGFTVGDQIAVAVDGTRYAISGSPPIEFQVGTAATEQLTGVTELPRVGITVVPADQIPTAIFAGTGAGSTGMVQVRGAQVTEVAGGSLREGHGITQTADGKVLVLGGGDGTTLSPDGVVITPGASPSATLAPGLLATPRRDVAMATTPRYIVAAGGLGQDGTTLTDAVVLEATTLAPITTLPLVVPRSGAVAVALQNDQILIAGGVDATGAPTSVVELFTADTDVE